MKRKQQASEREYPLRIIIIIQTTKFSSFKRSANRNLISNSLNKSNKMDYQRLKTSYKAKDYFELSNIKSAAATTTLTKS